MNADAARNRDIRNFRIGGNDMERITSETETIWMTLGNEQGTICGCATRSGDTREPRVSASEMLMLF
jgi:hypothetical protein